MFLLFDYPTKTIDLSDGGAEGSRTPDLLIANETLYQLSYDPIPRLLLWNKNRPAQAETKREDSLKNPSKAY